MNAPDETNLGFQVDAERVEDPGAHLEHEVVDVLGRRLLRRHEEVRMELGDRCSSDREALQPGRLDQTPRRIPRRVLERAPGVLEGTGLGLRPVLPVSVQTGPDRLRGLRLQSQAYIDHEVQGAQGGAPVVEAQLVARSSPPA